MPFDIHREKQGDREIVVGGPKPKVQPPPMEIKQGRKKMADDKKISDETGVKKISQEPADKQGPVGTGTENPPPRNPDVEIKIGGKEGEKNA